MARFVKPIPLVALGLCGCLGLLVWSEHSNWRAQVDIVAAELEQNAKTITQNADETFEYARAPLAAIALAVRQHSGRDSLTSALNATIERQLSFNPMLKGLGYIDRDSSAVAGGKLAGSGFEGTQLTNYILLHRNSSFSTMRIGAPYKDPHTSHWVVPVSQRVSKEDGSFQGIVLALFDVAQFSDFFRNFEEDEQDVYMLIGGDGTALARSPEQESFLGKNLSDGILFKTYLRRTPVGSLDVGSRVDGIRSVVSFYQSQNTGIVAVAAVSELRLFREWAYTAALRWSYAFGLFAAIALLAFLYQRQLRLRIRTETLLAQQNASFRLLAECSSDLIEGFDKSGFQDYASPSSEAILGVPPASLIGNNYFSRFEDGDAVAVQAAIARLEEGSLQEKVTFVYAKPSGQRVWLETALSRSSSSALDSDVHIVAATRDVTRHKKMEEELGALANTDELTLLANRRFFNIKLGEFVAQAKRSGRPVSLLMIDADHFKLFNDTYGHSAGDDCLRKLSAAVKAAVGEDGVAARYGGEELAVLMDGSSEEDAVKLAADIRQRIAAYKIRHEKNGPRGLATVSIGVTTTVPVGDYDPNELVNEADQALYQAKRSGRDRIVSWRPADTKKHA